jgi:hypothetical protein
VWPGSALSLFWLGLLGAVVVALGSLRRAAGAVASVACVTVVVLAVPQLAAMLVGTSQIASGSGRIVPAVVAAEARTNPQIGTLRLIPDGDDVLVAHLQRGGGATLDDQSTLASTAVDATDSQRTLARLAGNLASRGGYDPADDLAELYVGFVVLADVDPTTVTDVRAAEAVRERTADSLDGNPVVTAVGESASGLLWRIAQPPLEGLDTPASNTDSAAGRVILIAQGLVFFVALLLAIPTQRRRRTVRAPSLGDGPATTFDEELDD